MTITTAPTPSVAPAAWEVYVPASRSSADAGRAFVQTTKSEWIKANTIRSNKVILGLTVGVSGFVSWAVANFVTDELLTVAEVFTFATVFTAVFASIAGILIYSSEAQHGTLAPSLTAQSSRPIVAASKTVIAAGFGALLGLSGLLAGLGGSFLGGIEMGDTSTMMGDGGRAMLFAALAAVLGLGVGMIARHSTAAISGVLVWWLVIENLLSAFVAERFVRFLPFTAGNGLLGVSTGPGEDPGSAGSLALTVTENGLVFAGYAFAALVIGAVIFNRRDNN